MIETFRGYYPSLTRAWWAVGVFCFAAAVSYTDRLILSALADPVRHALNLTDSEISLLQGVAFALVYVVAGLWLGRLADKERRLTILVTGSALWCAGTIACGVAHSFVALFLARVVVGIGEAALAPAAVSIIGDSVPSSRLGRALGLFFLGFAVGGPASITVGEVTLSLAKAGTLSGIPLVGALEPWRAVLVLVGLLGLSVPILFLTLREPARRGSGPALPIRGMMTRLANDRNTLVPIYLAMSLLAIGDYGILTWMPSALTRRFAMPSADLGKTFGAVAALAGILGCVLGGVGSDGAARLDRTRGRLLFALGAAALASLGGWLVSSATITWSFAGIGLWTVCSVVSGISGTTAIQDLVPGEYRGMGMALVAFCNTLFGLGVGPTLVAWLAEGLYAQPASLGSSITWIALSASGVAAVLFLYSSLACRSRERVARA